MQIPMILITVIFSFAVPIGLMIYWKKRHNLPLFPFLAGSLCFMLFALGLEQIAHLFFLGVGNPISRTIQANPWLYIAYGCLAAGIFEETGRLFAFKVLMRNYQDREVSVAYGIGHGGTETIMTLGLTYALLLLVSLGVSLGDKETNEIIMQSAQIASTGEMLLAMLERISAMMLHIGLSILVFSAAKVEKKMYLYPLAILLHALANVIVGMYQMKMINNVLVVELIVFVISACIFTFCLTYYRRLSVKKAA